MPGATATSLGADPPVEVPTEHRPHLDGLRALAVYLVVLYHAGVGLFGSGFIGVDVFFVLSGYLVTQVLLRDLAGHGGIRLRRFYARRYRRLLPAAFVVLIVTAVGLAILGTAAEVANVEGGFQASFLYVANWYFIDQAADYFAADVNTNPVVHFWSLAVEEQFYLAWPLLLGALHVATRRARQPRRWIRAAVAGAAALSVLAALQLASTDLARAYYGTDTRAYQLLAGALLALSPAVGGWAARRRAAGGIAVAAVVGTLLLATTFDDLGPIGRGVAITAVTVALLVAVEASSPDGLVARGLSAPPVAYLGRVSYGTYLWHWPFIVLLGLEVTIDPVPLALLTCVVATGLAVLSFHLLERPVRTSRRLDRRPAPVIVAGLAISVVSAIVLVPAVLSTADATSIDVDWEAAQDDNPPLPECGPDDDVAGCTVVQGSGAHVLLLGDSNARMYIPAFTAIAERNDLTLSVAAQPLCPWPCSLFFLTGGEECRASRTFWYDDLIGELDPDVVVLAQRPMDDPASPVAVFAPEGRLEYGEPGYDEALAALSRETVANLRADGRAVVILEPIPIAADDDDPLSCLSSASDVDDCAYEANAEPTPLELAFRSEADGDGTWSVDLDDLVCPRLPTCDAVVDDLVVKRDANHITGTYSAHLADAIDARLRAEGIID